MLSTTPIPSLPEKVWLTHNHETGIGLFVVNNRQTVLEALDNKTTIPFQTMVGLNYKLVDSIERCVLPEHGKCAGYILQHPKCFVIISKGNITGSICVTIYDSKKSITFCISLDIFKNSDLIILINRFDLLSADEHDFISFD